jgi:hypothetical protein
MAITPIELSPPNGVTQVGTVTSISFDAQGRPNTAASLSITGDQTRTLTVEAETGYVHYEGSNSVGGMLGRFA